ncbi:sulfotransferase 1C4-like [Uloborus diversus]|uniref:sulfotransferase 1C4-like n=1 Tax=Uloborus diversus TaxID=327109 RepID=UPI002409730C|nr:sulfotransferase 1C4-like [Uloborus diversus]
MASDESQLSDDDDVDLDDDSDSERVNKKKLPTYVIADGFRLPGMFPAEAFRSALAYTPRPDDLFIVTFPKCGTTWVQNIVACIYRDGKPFQSALEFFTQTPFLEMTGAEAAETMKSPEAIKFHLAYHMTPMSAEAKYIFVARNPKEAFEKDPKLLQDVIYYSSFGFMKEHFNRHLAELCSLPRDVILNNPDIPSHLRQIFGAEKKLMKTNANRVCTSSEKVRKIHRLFNWGAFIVINLCIVGDWRNYLSPEQNERLERKFRAKTAGTELADQWKDDLK